jgi:beta-glucosidase
MTLTPGEDPVSSQTKPVRPGRAAEDDQEAPPYRDSSLSAAERARDLLGRMTLAEKLGQLGSLWSFDILDGTGLDEVRARARLRDGIGQITRVAGATNLPPEQVAAFGNQIQRFLTEETRLGIPAIIHEETLHGVMARDATCFPQSIGQAAAWDPGLVEEMARLIGRQLRTMGASQALAPVLDITRDPRWGRLEETYGEDPYLAAELGCAYVRGIQDTPSGERPVIATAKHMVGHGVPEGGLNQAPAHIGWREMLDTFLFPFEAAVREAGIGSVMHAYDDLDGLPCAASRELLTTILRERWGFEGVVVADYLGIEHLLTLHELVADLSDAAAMALRAGLDMELPATAAYGAPLRAAVEDGRVDETLVDIAVERVLRLKFRLGLFERPYAASRAAEAKAAETGPTGSGADVAEPAPAAVADPGREMEVALEMARRSVVLLENDGTLPLPADVPVIAVIGPNADSARSLVGDYGHIAHIETLLENRAREGVAGAAAPLDLQLADELATWSTVLDGIRARASVTTEVRYARGSGVIDGDDADISAAVAAAHGADVAILVLGERSGLTAQCTCGETRDRLALDLPGRQAELFEAVAATGTPIVLLLISGRPLAIPREAAGAAAVLHAWVPGEAGPRAIAEVLFGDVSPGGKLPITVPRNVGQVPLYYGHKPSGGRSQWHEDYVDGSHRPLWAFGHGLSYSRFELRGLKVDERVAIDGELHVSVEVANIGSCAADEVVQLYLRDLNASVTRPVKELRGFARIGLEPGERRTARFTLHAEQLAFTGVDGRLRVEPGRHRVMVGTSAVDLPLTAEFDVVGDVRELTERTHYLTTVSIG